MTASISEAKNQIFTILKVVLDNDSYPSDQVIWDDSPTDKPEGSTSFLYVELRHSGSQQASLSNTQGIRRWRNSGTLFITIDTPRNDGSNEMDQLQELIQTAYEGSTTSGQVWFRNSRVLQDKSEPRGWRRSRVLVDFEYDRIH